MRLHTPLSILGITIVLIAVMSATVIAAPPITPPPGGYTGGLFSFYFKSIIEGDGTVGTTSGGVCPAGQVIRGFSTAPATYGLPICVNPTANDGGASSLTGSLRGTVNYLPKYGATNTGIVNSQIFDNGTNVGIGTSTGTAKFTIAVTNGGFLGFRNSGSVGSQIDFNSQGAYIQNNGGSNEILGFNVPTSGYIGLRVNGVEGMRLHSNLNIGIGTAAPGQKLTVVDAGNTNSYSGTFSVFANNLTQGIGIGYMGVSSIGSAAFQALSLNAKGTGSITMQVSGSTGNVGIGTSGPTQKLQVSGDILADNYRLPTTPGNGICFWNDCTQFKISMGSSAEYVYGPVTGYSIKTQMDTANTNRGFTWGQVGLAPVAAINATTGNMQIAGTMTAPTFIGNLTGNATTASGVPWTGVSGKPTTAAGYGITDVVTTAGNQTIAGTKTFSSAIAGSITGNAATATALQTPRTINGVSFNGTANITVPETDPKVGTLALNYTPKWNGSALTNSIIYDNGISIGIGTSAPAIAAKLDVLGKVKITDGTQGSGKVLYGDGNGLASWGDLPADLPVGTVMSFNSISCPAGWAVADGTSGTPDLRGEFVRGLDMGRGVNTGRTLGSWEDSMFGSHQHLESNVANSGTTNVDSIPRPVWGQSLTTASTSGQHQELLVDAAARAAEGDERHYFTSSSGGIETRPRNVALLYCMKISTYTAPAPQTWYNTTSTASGDVALATTGDVGVGTTTPEAKLDVVGTMKITDGTQGTGKVLTSDGTGNATWQQFPGDLPIGTVMAFNSTSCPAGWAVANGTLGTPDLRGEFVRGLDSGRGVDTGRVLGSQQRGSMVMSASAASDIRIFMLTANSNVQGNLGYDSPQPVGGLTYTWNQANGTQGSWAVGTVDNNYVGASRPRNVALLYCMKISVAPGALSNSGTWVNVSGTSTGHVALGTSGNVGVGTTTPTEKLEVQGSIKVVDGNQGTGKVLISDASGKATWQEMPGDLPVGSIMPFNGASCPAGWAVANGTGGTPDLRGEFVRGLDSGRGVDTGRTLASAQGQDFKGFSMLSSYTSYTHAAYMGKSTSSYVGNLFGGYWSSTAGCGGSCGNSLGVQWDGSEVRPRNVALLYCMKVSAAPATASNSVTWMNVDGTSSGRVSLATTGNVGIGTAAPTAKLEVIGAGDNTIDVKLSGRVEINSTASPGIWYRKNGDAVSFAGRDDTIVPNQAWGVWTASGGWNSFNVYQNGNIKVGPFFFDGNDDTWMRLRDGEGGAYKDLAVGQLYAASNITGLGFYYNSDISLKDNIQKIVSPIDKLMKLNGYTFNWKDSNKADVGIIAQEVEQVFPELVSTNPETGLKTVQYGNLVAPIIEAIKELAAQVKSLHTLIEEQQSDIRKLQSENAELRSRLEAIEARLAQ